MKSERWGKNGIQKSVGLTPVLDEKHPFPLETLAEMWGFFIPRIFHYYLLFPSNGLKESIKAQKPIIAIKKMGVTEEGTYMDDESKNKADCQNKAMGLFYFYRSTNTKLSSKYFKE